MLPGTVVDIPVIVISVDSVTFDTLPMVVAMVVIVPFIVLSVVALLDIVEFVIISFLVVSMDIIDPFCVVSVAIKGTVGSVDIFRGVGDIVDSLTVDILTIMRTVVSFIIGIVKFVAVNNW